MFLLSVPTSAKRKAKAIAGRVVAMSRPVSIQPVSSAPAA